MNLNFLFIFLAAADKTSMISSPDLSHSVSSSNLTRYALWSEPRDVWCLKIDPLWIDFLGARSVGQAKSVPFVDAVPITLWVHGKSMDSNFVSLISTFRKKILLTFTILK